MSDFINKYPYTDFHELNLDWILETVQKVVEEWDVTQQAWHDEQEAFQALHDYVMNYFDNLNLQAEVNIKIDQMASDGTLDAIILPYFNEYKTEINDIISQISNDYAVLKSRVDSFTNLEEGSTTGDAELIDGRTDYTGEVFTNIGGNIRYNQQYTADSISNFGDTFIPPYDVLTSYWCNTAHVVQTSSYYDMIDNLRILPLQMLKVTGYAYANEPFISIFDTSGNFERVTSVGAGNDTMVTKYYINYSDHIQIAKINISKVNPTYTIEVSSYHTKLNEYFCDGYFQDTAHLDNIVRVNHVPGQPTITNPFYCIKGQTILINQVMNYNTPVIVKCDKYGNNRTLGITQASFVNNQYRYYVTESTYYMVVLANQGLQNITVKDVRLTPEEKYGNTRNMPVITFVFDDTSPNDANIVDIFAAKGLKCGFAIPTNMGSAITPYLEYYKNGFDILSHSTDFDPMSDSTLDPATIRDKMTASKRFLDCLGFSTRGWVTPSSILASNFKPLLDTVYDYAYTDLHDPGERWYNIKTDNVRSLQRVYLPNSTTNLKNEIDTVIANNGFASFYFHGDDVDATYTTVLTWGVNYLRQKMDNFECMCLAPNDAFDFYYRH